VQAMMVSMENKFGRVVNLEEVELVSADNDIEDVRRRLTRSHNICDKEMMDTEFQMRALEYEKIMNMRYYELA
jgi:hypothetical protein